MEIGNNRNCWYTVMMAKCHTFWSDNAVMKRHHRTDPIHERASDTWRYRYTSTSIKWRLKMSLALCYLHTWHSGECLANRGIWIWIWIWYDNYTAVENCWKIYNFWVHLGTNWEIVLLSYYLYCGLWAVLLRSLPLRESKTCSWRVDFAIWGMGKGWNERNNLHLEQLLNEWIRRLWCLWNLIE